jgi:site-specific DNA-methyltransferase (adenine-specific)
VTTWTLHTGDALERLRSEADDSFDACFCDPPYGLSFMGKKWDYDLPSPEVFTELLRVLKPGAPLLMFGGSRTWHRLAVRIEDSGFELRDTLVYLYVSGMPNGLNLSKAIDSHLGYERPVIVAKTTITGPGCPESALWDGYNTAMKPAYEGIILARKPLDGTYVDNALAWGTGGLNIDGTRIGTSGGTAKARHPNIPSAIYGNRINGGGWICLGKGRWPSNVLFDEEAAAQLDAEVGLVRSGGTDTVVRKATKTGFHNGTKQEYVGVDYADTGKASRFFFCSKVSTKEREYGLGKGVCTHPTPKPIELTTYLAKLILQPGPNARLLVPFAGVGSEMIGALKAGWGHVTGIEREVEYVAIAEQRIPAWLSDDAPKPKARRPLPPPEPVVQAVPVAPESETRPVRLRKRPSSLPPQPDVRQTLLFPTLEAS